MPVLIEGEDLPLRPLGMQASYEMDRIKAVLHVLVLFGLFSAVSCSAETNRYPATELRKQLSEAASQELSIGDSSEKIEEFLKNKKFECQSAWERDPGSACKRDPL
jgi:hypothetical protein